MAEESLEKDETNRVEIMRTFPWDDKEVCWYFNNSFGK